MANRQFSPGRRDVLQTSIAMATAGLAGLSPARAAPGARPQEEPAKPAAAVPARARDVESIDAIIAALYDSISGPPGRRDWDRIRSLFHPGARLIPCFPTTPDQERGPSSCRVLTIDEFIKAIERSVKEQGFFEREIARRVERFGAIAHVFSTYESRRSEKDAQPFVRGINSIQLFFDGKRWWTVTIFWDGERPGQPIPVEYLPRRR
jgi:hypothetical protein